MTNSIQLKTPVNKNDSANLWKLYSIYFSLRVFQTNKGTLLCKKYEVKAAVLWKIDIMELIVEKNFWSLKSEMKHNKASCIN